MSWFRKRTEEIELKEVRLPLGLAMQIARYMALARRLDKDSEVDDYELANRLSWELAMQLPEELYKDITLAIAHPGPTASPLTVAIAVRKLVLGSEAGNLRANDIAWHAPGAGKKTILSEEQVV